MKDHFTSIELGWSNIGSSGKLVPRFLLVADGYGLRDMVMMSFLSDCQKAFVISTGLRNGGPPGPERMRGEQGGGRLARQAGITHP